MTKRIFRSIYIVAIAVFLVSLALIEGILYDYFTDTQFKQLDAQAQMAAHGVEMEGEQFLQGLQTRDYRITWIDADGTVLYDSDTDAGSMENHLEREEVQEALETGYGESDRYSDTVTERLLYTARRAEDGTVIRISCVQNSVLTLTLGMLQPFCVVALAALVISVLLASRLSKEIVKPLNELDLEKPLSNEGYDELAPLLRRIDSQQRQLKEQEQTLRQRQEEWSTVADSMNEGLMLLNRNGRILTINHAAARLLGTGRDCVGQDILTVSRSLELQEVLGKAEHGEQAERVISLAGGSYQLMASPVRSSETVTGTALLLFDVTEQEQAEQMRREFTANVSHELKTPLHTISGCAELLNHDMVKPEDVKQFTGTIYSEAQRMICLVEDIIRLSHLDEGTEEMGWEKTDLYKMAEETLSSLSSAAAENGLTLKLEGEGGEVFSIPQLVSGMMFNLCDNAVKYNKKGGSVTVRVGKTENGVKLTVSDTGIGIPPEDQSRIFERFYRVDKSRSKEVGGTGLGLSIVKHTARVLGAKVELESTLGKGTTITVLFPKTEQA